MGSYDMETLEKAKKLRIIDDALFRLIAVRKEVCQEILRTLLDEESFYDGEYPHLSKAMQHFKDTQEGRDKMCNVIEEYANEIADKRAVDATIKICIMHDDSKEKTIEMVYSEFPQFSEEQISKRVSELWDK